MATNPRYGGYYGGALRRGGVMYEWGPAGGGFGGASGGGGSSTTAKRRRKRGQATQGATPKARTKVRSGRAERHAPSQRQERVSEVAGRASKARTTTAAGAARAKRSLAATSRLGGVERGGTLKSRIAAGIRLRTGSTGARVEERAARQAKALRKSRKK